MTAIEVLTMLPAEQEFEVILDYLYHERLDPIAYKKLGWSACEASTKLLSLCRRHRLALGFINGCDPQQPLEPHHAHAPELDAWIEHGSSFHVNALHIPVSWRYHLVHPDGRAESPAVQYQTCCWEVW